MFRRDSPRYESQIPCLLDEIFSIRVSMTTLQASILVVTTIWVPADEKKIGGLVRGRGIS